MDIKGITKKSAAVDIFTGIIIALVSIPISMGYAQVSGLPAVYGLYGSIFPILIYGLFSSSKQFIFGVDAAPAALVGAYLASVGVASGSEDAMRLVPAITFFTGVWLFLLFLFRAGKMVTYISTPVMGGFISGISTTIIFMQIPKILGGTSGCGEMIELVEHIVETCKESFNPMSLLLGAVSLAILLLFKKIAPKLPMSIAVMAGGAVLGYTGFADKYGIARLGAVDGGLPKWHLPDLMVDDLSGVLTTSLTIAIVIMAETLLASSSLAAKSGEKLDGNREILVYSMGNLAACFTGCCPVNGSVSRSAMGEQYGGRSQLMSVTASVTMIVILLSCTGFIQFLPVPVLTAIVISALLGTVEFHLMKRLFKQDRKELMIFFGAFFGVLIFGTIYGVVIGVILSFVEVLIRTANPKRSFLGVIEGHEGFHSLERNSDAAPLKDAVIYRFSGNLYFANINTFTDEIEAAVTAETKCVVVDSGAICSVDITAADKIAQLRDWLKEKGIALYFASHIGSLNDRFRQLGLGDLVEKGFCRMTISSALTSAGIKKPYETVRKPEQPTRAANSGFGRLEFEWAFGDSADEKIEMYAKKLIAGINDDSDPEKQLEQIIKVNSWWKNLSESDQEEILEHLELHIKELSERLDLDMSRVDEAIEKRKLRLVKKLVERDPGALAAIREHDRRLEESLRAKDPQLYETLMEHRREALEHLRDIEPEYRDIIGQLYMDEECISE